MKFIFLRHAQATHNSDAKLRGDIAYMDPVNADAALNIVGLEQLVTDRQQIPDVDAIYCSPLRRCRQTLLGVLPEAEDVQVLLDDRLMEPQGKATCNRRAEYDELRSVIPPTWDMKEVARTNPFDSANEGYSVDVGTSRDFYSRIRDFTESIVTSYNNEQTILIVSHHDWIRTWFSIYTHLDVRPRNCELLRVSFDSKKLIEAGSNRLHVQ